MKNHKNARWIVKHQCNDSIFYETDCFGCLSGAGKEEKKKLAGAGITQLFQLAVIGNNKNEVNQTIKEIAETTKLTVSAIQSLHIQALEAEHRDFPQEINQLLADKPL